MAADAEGTAPSDYRFWITEHIRFADLDVLGHVNNRSFLVYAEGGRAEFMLQNDLWHPNSARQNVLARLEVDYRRELHYPGEVRVGVRVLKVGRSSFTLGVGLFEDGLCAATVTSVLVRIDSETRAAVALDAEERTRLQTWIMPG